jgi:hypothetical protein
MSSLASQPSLDGGEEGKANAVRYPWTDEVRHRRAKGGIPFMFRAPLARARAVAGKGRARSRPRGMTPQPTNADARGRPCVGWLVVRRDSSRQ